MFEVVSSREPRAPRRKLTPQMIRQLDTLAGKINMSDRAGTMFALTDASNDISGHITRHTRQVGFDRAA